MCRSPVRCNGKVVIYRPYPDQLAVTLSKKLLIKLSIHLTKFCYETVIIKFVLRHFRVYYYTRILGILRYKNVVVVYHL